MKEIEKWKSSLMTMPDASFFELLRTVFGKIKTPFNKQQLLKDLEKFLLRDDIQKTIAAYIDTQDTKVISAVALFDGPTPEELERFFADEFSSVQLHDIIVNLEERFILYRFKDEQKFRLALNPVLEKVLAPAAADISLLFPLAQFPAAAKTKQSKPTVVLNDRVLAGLLSFVLQWENTTVYKKEGQLRKQILDAAKTCFPGLNTEETLGALRVLGLFYTEGENLYSDKSRFKDIALLSVLERMEYCAASLIVYKEAGYPADIQAPYYKNRIKEAVNFIHALMDSICALYKDTEKENYFTEKTIARLIEIQKSKTEYNINTNYLIEILVKTELILQASANHFHVNSSFLTPNSSFLTPPCSIDSSFTVLVYPEINFTDAVELASFLNIKEAGAIVRFELEKSSAVRAFDNGIAAQQIIDMLNRLSGKKLPDTLAWNLKDWEKRHNEVSLKKGVVLTLAKDKHYLAQTKPLSALITETLAPGVYLLNEDAEEESAAALHNAGVDIIKRGYNTNKNSNIKTTANAHHYFLAPSDHLIHKKFKPFFNNTSKIKNEKNKSNEKVFDQLAGHAILEKMTLSKADRDELSARIDRRLILCESQLKDAIVRYEKLEARLMDYTGKQNIAKHAIAQGSPVEVVYAVNKSAKQVYGLPKALEKEGQELFLTITPVGKDDDISIPLAKISLLRRIKKSIFEG